MQEYIDREKAHRLIRPVDRFQEELTKGMVLPYRSEILLLVKKIRARVDSQKKKYGVPSKKKARVRRRTIQPPSVRLRGDRVYPVGACRFIRGQVWNEMISGEHAFRFKQILRPFSKAGGHINPFYSIQREAFFQNGIQIGSHFLDAASNTVDSNQREVTFNSLEEDEVVNITSFQQRADIEESYQSQRVFPNLYCPFFVPICPTINIRCNGTLEIPRHEVLLWNVEQDYKLARDFLFSSHYQDRVLPEPYRELFWKAVEEVYEELIRTLPFPYSNHLQLMRRIHGTCEMSPLSKERAGEMFDRVQGFRLSQSDEWAEFYFYLAQEFMDAVNKRKIRPPNGVLQRLKDCGELPDIEIDPVGPLKFKSDFGAKF